MLIHLAVRDLLLLEHAALDFAPGMTALTGETGAGKSMLIDALALALGERAAADMVRGENAEITACFALDHCPAARTWLVEQALATGEDCIVRRVISRQGRGRAFINGRPVSTGQLRALGALLVDIHGQHAHHLLLDGVAQCALLDEYGGHHTALRALATAYRHYRALETRWQEAQTRSEQRSARSELLRMQLEELATTAPSAAELTALEAEQRRLAHLDRLQETVARLVQTLYEGEAALGDVLGRAARELTALSALDARLAASAELLDTAEVQIAEAATQLRQYLAALELNPARLAEIEARLANIHALARKYRVLPQHLPELIAERRAELAALEHEANNITTLERDCAAAYAAAHAQAQALSAARQQAAAALGAAVTALMGELGMAGGELAIAVEPATLTARGCDQVTFLVRTNPGQPLQPLAKVASGGELSRIGLAIQVATARCGGVPTLVFDEVDVGIGGAVAEIVGQLLRRLGANRQVLCVTHLPQVAAQAHHHLRVSKRHHSGGVQADIEALGLTQRVEELARMLGGTDITATTRAHAAELLRRPVERDAHASS